MSPSDEERSRQRIAKVRAIFRKAAEKCGEHGATVEDSAIAAMYAAFDIAELHAGPDVFAIEWMRNACNVIEAELMGPDRRSADGA